MNTENNKRLEILYKKHNDWLFRCALNNTKNKFEAEELVSNLYLYLSIKGNQKLYYLDSFNLKYCYTFLKSRFINSKKAKKLDVVDDDLFNIDVEDIEYNYYEDQIIDETYKEILDFLNNFKKTKKSNFTSARIFELYFKDEDTTIDSLSEQLNISRSTVFLNVKKIKEIIKEEINNPFQKIKNK